MLVASQQRRLTDAAKAAIRVELQDEEWQLDADALARDIVWVLEHTVEPIEEACDGTRTD